MSGKHKYLLQKFSDYGTKSKWLKINSYYNQLVNSGHCYWKAHSYGKESGLWAGRRWKTYSRHQGLHIIARPLDYDRAPFEVY